MLDIGWTELLLIGGVALVVIGPKDLPRALRTLGQTTTKVRRMASDFQRQFNDAMREADMEEFRKGVSDVVDTARDLKNNFNPVDRLRNEIKGAIDSPEAARPLPTVEVPSAGDYLTSLPELPPLDAPATELSAKAGKSAEAGKSTETGKKPARRKRSAAVAASGLSEADLAGEVVGDAPATKPARAPRKTSARAPKTSDTETTRKTASRRKVVAADAETVATAPAKRARRSKTAAAAVANPASAPVDDAVELGLTSDTTPVVAPNKIASDGTA